MPQKKFMQSLRHQTYDDIHSISMARGITDQELMRAVIITDYRRHHREEIEAARRERHNPETVGRKFMQSLESSAYEDLEILARKKGTSIQEIIRNNVVPEYIALNVAEVEDAKMRVKEMGYGKRIGTRRRV